MPRLANCIKGLSMTVIPLPRFNFAETERVARLVGFNPKTPGLARDCLRDVQELEVSLPEHLPEPLRIRALFYAALGVFIYSEFIESGEPLSPFVQAWYELNIALTVGGTDGAALFMWG